MRVSLMVAAVTIAHRAVMWQLFKHDLDACARANPDWLTWQYLTVAAYRDHFWRSIWYLQQTPPLPHFVLGLLVRLRAWPVEVMQSLVCLQVLISAATAGALCGLLRSIGFRRPASVGLALWFSLSTDLYVMEVNSLAQLIYESGAMALITLACLSLSVTLHPQSTLATTHDRRLALSGVLVAATALTRSSFCYLFLPLCFLVFVIRGWRRALIFLVPVLVLHGGWSVKTWAVYGDLDLALSSWAGMNATVGFNYLPPMGSDFVASILRNAHRHPSWFVKLIQKSGYVSWHTKLSASDLPFDIQERERQIQQELGGTNRQENRIATALVSKEYLKELKYFAPLHAKAIWNKFRAAYQIYWQPIANYSSMFVGPIFTTPQVRRPGLQLLPESREQAFAMAGKFPWRDAHARTLPTVSLFILDSICILLLHIALPLTVVSDLLNRLLRKPPIMTPTMWMLTCIGIYGAVLFNVTEYGENMRFRLTLEPVYVALSSSLLVVWLRRARRIKTCLCG